MQKIRIAGVMDGSFESINRVYDSSGLSPTINTCGGGNRQPMIVDIVAMRGRDPNNPSDRTPGNKNLEQTLEINKEKIINTLTTVQKDNMVLESIKLGNAANSNQRCAVYDEYALCPTIQAAAGAGGNQQPMWVEVKQATKEGYIKCEVGGVADLNYPSSKTRRGRVQGSGQISPTLTTESTPSVIEQWTWEIEGELYLIRIRKLTPRECWRLMNFTNQDFENAEKVNSNTQLYKQAGNSIVKNVLCAAFSQLFEGKEEIYKEIV